MEVKIQNHKATLEFGPLIEDHRGKTEGGTHLTQITNALWLNCEKYIKQGSRFNCSDNRGYLELFEMTQ